MTSPTAPLDVPTAVVPLEERVQSRSHFDDDVFQLQESLLGPPRYSSFARCRLPVLGTAEEQILIHWEAEMKHRWFFEDVQKAALRGRLGWQRPHESMQKSKSAM